MKTAARIPQLTPITKARFSAQRVQILPRPSGVIEQAASASRPEEMEEIECLDCESSIEILVVKPCRCGGSHASAGGPGR